MVSALMPFGIYVAWHPDYKEGKKIAASIYRHFATSRDRSVSGGVGVHVLYRSNNVPRADIPLPINWNRTVDTAVVVLVDSVLTSDPSWVRYIRKLVHEAESRDFGTRVFPVVVTAGGIDVCQDIQAMRWYTWDGNDDERVGRLIRDLTHEFIRMLRYRLEADGTDTTDNLENYTKSINIFLSHSTNDPYGRHVAEAIRDWLHDYSSMSSFLAPRDIPPGVQFGTVINNSIQDSAVAIIYTDSYSSREWCRREVIEAKRMGSPMLVVDCLESVDERSFPYMGNVPIIRMDPTDIGKISLVAGRLLDEVFKHFLWWCGVAALRESSTHATFMARPPELLSLVTLPNADGGGARLVVYPDPPLGTEEMDLFSGADHNLHLLSLNQWQEAGS